VCVLVTTKYVDFSFLYYLDLIIFQKFLNLNFHQFNNLNSYKNEGKQQNDNYTRFGRFVQFFFT